MSTFLSRQWFELEGRKGDLSGVEVGPFVQALGVNYSMSYIFPSMHHLVRLGRSPCRTDLSYGCKRFRGKERGVPDDSNVLV